MNHHENKILKEVKHKVHTEKTEGNIEDVVRLSYIITSD